MLKNVTIKYVDELPSVNLTDSFLITKREKDNFKENLREFFLYFMERYFIPEALNKNSNGQIKLFRPVKSKKYYNGVIRSALFKKVPKGVKEQKDYAKKLLSKIKTYEALCEMLTSSGRNTFLLRKDINVFTFTSYKEVFECLTGIKKDYRRDFLMLVQLFSVFLHEKGICLWPLGRFKKERIWLGFYRAIGTPFCQNILRELEKATLTKMQKETVNDCGYTIFRATTWNSLHDIKNAEILNIREKLKDVDASEKKASVIHILSAAGAELGVAGISYESQSKRAGKTKSKGRQDGTFSYYENGYQGKDFLVYWIKRAKDFIAYQRDVSNLSKASIRNYCDSLNQFFDYLLYVDSFGQTLSSVKDISRDKHIAFKSPESEKDPQTFAKFIEGKDFGRDSKQKAISQARVFLEWIILTEGLNIRNPITEFDVPPRGRRPLKTLRIALTPEMYTEVRSILIHDSLPYYETVFENGIQMKKLSPTLSTYMLCRLSLSIRHGQTVYLDKDKVIDPDGILISGDKNVNRQYLQIIPAFDDELIKKIKECQEWQNKYNIGAFETEPVWYGGNTNSLFGKIKPLFRLIGRNSNPVDRLRCHGYMVQVFLEMQKRLRMEGKDQIVKDKNGNPLDMSKIDSNKITPTEAINNFRTEFDLHSFRTTAATIMFEHGVSPDTIRHLTGHTTIAMLMYYVQIRDGEKTLREALDKIVNGNRRKVEDSLSKNIDETINKFLLTSRVSNPKYKNMEGVSVIKNTPRPFWQPMVIGICPTGACLENINGRCSLCPYLISGPPYKIQLAMMANLVLEQIVTAAGEMKISGYDVKREAQLEQHLEEWIGYHGWLRHIEVIEKEVAEGGKIQLYAQIKYEPVQVSQFMLHLQRCVDISVCPELYSETAARNAKGLLQTLIAHQPEASTLNQIIDNLVGIKAIQKTADVLIRQLNEGKRTHEIEALLLSGTTLSAEEDLLLETSIKEGTDAETKN